MQVSSRLHIPSNEPKPPKRDVPEGFWTELFSGELNEIGLHFSADFIEATIDGAQTVGEGIKNAWTGLYDKASDLLDLDPSNRVFPPGSHKIALDTVMTVAKGAGYLAAGVQGLGGVYKLHSGIKEGSRTKKIDAVFDLATSAAVATTVAGLPLGTLFLGPIAAGLGVVRGGYNAVVGYLVGDGRKEIQGALDATRAASVGLRLASVHNAALGVAGSMLGPVAGAIQATRGFYDVQAGLETDNKERQMKGLMDIGSAVGLTMAMTGVGVIPGIAITALSMGSRLLYQFNDKYAARCNKTLERHEPTLKKAVTVVEKVASPVLNTARRVIKFLFSTERGEVAKNNPRPDIPETSPHSVPGESLH